MGQIAREAKGEKMCTGGIAHFTPLLQSAPNFRHDEIGFAEFNKIIKENECYIQFKTLTA